MTHWFSKNVTVLQANLKESLASSATLVASAWLLGFTSWVNARVSGRLVCSMLAQQQNDVHRIVRKDHLGSSETFFHHIFDQNVSVRQELKHRGYLFQLDTLVRLTPAFDNTFRNFEC